MNQTLNANSKCSSCLLLFIFLNTVVHFLSSSSHSVLSVYEVKSCVEEFPSYRRCCDDDPILVYVCVCVSSPVTQVVSVVISCPSQSSPPTADCGLSSAAAVTGWEKVSPLFMRVSTHSPDLPAPYSSSAD